MTYSDATREWAEKWDHCFRCGRRGQWPTSLQCHHFVRGSSRHADELATIGIVCEQCHYAEHNGRGLFLAEWLAVKMVNDPTNYSRERVNELRRRAKNAVSSVDVAVEVRKLFIRAPFR